MSWIRFAPGLTEVGVTPPADGLDSFAFDNETPRHTVYVAPFALASRPVTSAEYLAFMEDDGYRRPELWLAEGWTTLRAERWEAPLYWRRRAEEWSIFTLSGFQPLAALSETPVCHLSFFEADAYARWAGHRLPSEFEWECAATSLCTHREGGELEPRLLIDALPAQPGAAVPAVTANLVETAHLNPCPAVPVTGLQQIYGDVWEWTHSGYTGYPGYRPLAGVLGEYNGKFMSSQMVLRGGSCVTPATHIRPTYRNFFSPATRWQFSGLRLAQDA
jgi:ergothioneine biosynthesis protein EgtB